MKCYEFKLRWFTIVRGRAENDGYFYRFTKFIEATNLWKGTVKAFASRSWMRYVTELPGERFIICSHLNHTMAPILPRRQEGYADC